MTDDNKARPQDQEGQLLPGDTGPLAPMAVLEQLLPRVTAHLESVAWWPEEAAGRDWQIGDFAFYVLEFRVAETAQLYAQVWSEPDEGVIVEVSSGAWNPPAAEYISAGQRESLLNRGFEAGGKAGNYRKVIHLAQPGDCRRLARELLSILTECLGYDGTTPLDYKLHLGRRTATASVFNSMTFDDLGRLLKSWGFAVEKIARDNRRSYRSTVGIPFIATLNGESDDRPGEWDGFTVSLYASLPPGVLGRVEHELRRELPFAHVTIDDDGDLAVSQLIYVGGGVTDTHLRHLMNFWRHAQDLTQTVIRKHCDKTDTRVLN